MGISSPCGTGRIARRDLLKQSVAMAAGAALSPGLATAAELGAEAWNTGFGRDWSQIRGFNYQPSYGSNGFELWQKFDARVIEIELGRGKRYFPKINALRWWQSWDSFVRDPKRYADHFETTLRIAAGLNLAVMPVLFNRWHNATLDYGGVYIDHFLPGASWIYRPNLFDAYLEAIVGGHKDDPRILAWDLCNEPYSYGMPREKMLPAIVEAETQWLKGLYDKCKQLGAAAPITVGIHPGVPLELVDPFVDVLSIHPYWVHNNKNAKKEAYESKLDGEVAFARKTKKPLVATECCWGSLDDAVRVESIRYTLTQLKKRNIGWLVYLLHHSLIADAHGPGYGPVGGPENLSFIQPDGSLRPGHEVFNEF
jgi:hypothetical protein